MARPQVKRSSSQVDGYKTLPSPDRDQSPTEPDRDQSPTGFGRDQSPTRGNPCRSVLWFLALIFFGWPAAFMICPFYILLGPFGPCCNCMRIITDALLLGVQLPTICSENMLKQVQFC